MAMSGKGQLFRLSGSLVVLVACCAAKGNNDVKDKTARSIPSVSSDLSSDLVPSISDPKAEILLVRTEEAQLHVESSHTEAGHLGFRVLQVLSAPGHGLGETIEVPVQREADPERRPDKGFNPWNVLSLAKGSLMVLAVRETGKAGRLQAVAVVAVDSPDAALVGAVRRC